ncbi:hypothetical protein [Abyssisolibacter fermentans]|uniref:hypothetical protein n=1 Tax=Abyssisolibacter fermentans TaxID=1766203 RepID=UPI00082CBFE4|nr:hypothetical protein [Abyssisolibacter fermentans]
MDFGILICIIIVVIIVIEIFLRTRRIAKNSREYKIISSIEINIPVLLLLINYFYFQTDVFWEWTLISILCVILVLIGELSFTLLEKIKYNYFVLPIEFTIITIIYILILRYVLSYIPESILFGICGAFTGSTMYKIKINKSKVRLSGIITMIIMLLFLGNFEADKQIKPIRKVSEYAQSLGYFNTNEEMHYYMDYNGHNNPIHIVLFNFNEDKKIIANEFDYFKDEVIEINKN